MAKSSDTKEYITFRTIKKIILCCVFIEFHRDKRFSSCFQEATFKTYEPRQEITNNVVCATSKSSDHNAHTHSLVIAFASRLNII